MGPEEHAMGTEGQTDKQRNRETEIKPMVSIRSYGRPINMTSLTSLPPGVSVGESVNERVGG